MKLPTPQELGFPEKYEKWRPAQEQVIEIILHDEHRVSAICQGTGGGKTGGYVAGALISKKPTCIVTESKGLQQQLMDDFSGCGMVSLMGRKNYICGMKDDYTCEDGYPAQCPYRNTPMCPSSQAEMRMATSYLGVTNYAKWTHSRKFGQGMNHWQQVIFDEGDVAYDALADAMQVTLHHKEVNKTLGMDFLEQVDDFKPWKSWAGAAKDVASDALVLARRKMIGANPSVADIRHFNHMTNLVRRLNTLATASARDWVVDQVDRGFQFDPISPGRYCESALLLRVPRVVIISATIRPKTMFMLGIGQDNFSFREFPSEFDPARSPVYWVPTMRVDGKAHDLSQLWLKHDQIAARRRDVKGIVHTISYNRRDQILEQSRFASSMFVNERGEPPTRMVDEFKMADPGAILVSPSVGRGYDFPDDHCRWQLVLKVPFEPPSKIQKARQAVDKEYVYYRAMQYLVQAFGRDMRGPKDWSERFICDNHFGEWFMPRYGHLAPRSFHATYKIADILPKPLRLS